MLATTPVPRPAAPGALRLSVIIPAYREVAHIAQAIERVRADLSTTVAPSDLEVVVVDDGSGDGTAEAAAGADLVVAQSVNRGKGAAVRMGMLAASGRTRVFTDADLSYAPSQIVRLLEEVEVDQQAAGVAAGLTGVARAGAGALGQSPSCQDIGAPWPWSITAPGITWRRHGRNRRMPKVGDDGASHPGMIEGS